MGMTALSGPEGGLPGAARPARSPKDQTDNAIAFFSSERTPAALIAGATLGVLFVFPLVSNEPLRFAVAKRAYISLMCVAFCNALFSLFASSLAIVRLMAGFHDPIAPDPLAMLEREFRPYYLSTRAHFLTALMCFAGGLSIRMFAEYTQGCPIFSRAMVSLLGSSVLFMTAMFNRSLVGFSSLAHVWVAYVKSLFHMLYVRRDGRGLSASPCAIGAMMLLALGLYDATRVAYFLLSAICPLSRAAPII
jgi:hypothetical protein